MSGYGGGFGATPRSPAATLGGTAHDPLDNQSCLTVDGGNPQLRPYEANSFDVSVERYFRDEISNIAVALFYKDLKDPIERVVQPASGTAGNSRTFRNADSAELYGIELDLRKDFSFDERYDRTFFIAFNGSYIDSEVTLTTGEKRKLQGQPDYTLNVVLGYDDLPTRQQLTLLLNQSGDNIVDVGVSGRPDVIEEPRLALDVNYKFDVTADFALKAKVKNLLDSEVEFTQGGKVFQSYDKGMELEAGFDWNF